jgi:hypothetical protein
MLVVSKGNLKGGLQNDKTLLKGGQKTYNGCVKEHEQLANTFGIRDLTPDPLAAYSALRQAQQLNSYRLLRVGLHTHPK